MIEQERPGGCEEDWKMSNPSQDKYATTENHVLNELKLARPQKSPTGAPLAFCMPTMPKLTRSLPLETAQSSRCAAESAAAVSNATTRLKTLLVALTPVLSRGLSLAVRGGKLPLVLFSHFHALATL